MSIANSAAAWQMDRLRTTEILLRIRMNEHSLGRSASTGQSRTTSPKLVSRALLHAPRDPVLSKMLRRLLPALLLALAHPVAAQVAGEIDEEAFRRTPTAEQYGIRPGDHVSIRLFAASGEEINQVTGERTVDSNGAVYLPLVGAVQVAGETEPSLRQLIIDLYQEFYDSPVVNVEVQLRVNITGAVGSPGHYFLEPTATVLDAMAEAGGIASELSINGLSLPADPTRVRLLRHGELYVLNLRPEEVSDENLNLRILSGDWYHVPTRSRSRVRDEIQFWGSVMSFVATAVGLVFLATGGR